MLNAFAKAQEGLDKGAEPMNIRLNYTGTIDVRHQHHLRCFTKAPGLQHLCRWAITQVVKLTKPPFVRPFRNFLQVRL